MTKVLGKEVQTFEDIEDTYAKIVNNSDVNDKFTSLNTDELKEAVCYRYKIYDLFIQTQNKNTYNMQPFLLLHL